MHCSGNGIDTKCQSKKIFDVFEIIEESFPNPKEQEEVSVLETKTRSKLPRGFSAERKEVTESISSVAATMELSNVRNDKIYLFSSLLRDVVS